MGILSNIEPPRKNTPSCHVRTVLQRLDEGDQKIFNEWLADRDTWSGMAISKVMNQQGIVISSTSVNHHRRGMCSCSKI
jgi:hypothetical protein